jgi:hypothetical protein
VSERLKTPSYPGRDHDRRWLISLQAGGDAAKAEALEEALSVLESDDEAPPLSAEQRFANAQYLGEPADELAGRIASRRSAAAAQARQEEDDTRPQRLIALRNTLINKSGMKKSEVANLLQGSFFKRGDIQLLRRYGLASRMKAAQVLAVVEKAIAAEGYSDPGTTTHGTRPSGTHTPIKYLELNRRQDEVAAVKQSIEGVKAGGPAATLVGRPGGALVAWMLGYDPLKGSEVGAAILGMGDVAMSRRGVTPMAPPASAPTKPVAAEIRPAAAPPAVRPATVNPVRPDAPTTTAPPRQAPSPASQPPAGAAPPKPPLMLAEPSPAVKQRDVVAGREAAVQEATRRLNERTARAAAAERDLDAARRQAAEAEVAAQRAREAADRAGVAAVGAKRTSTVAKDATQARRAAESAESAQTAAAKAVKRADDALFEARRRVAKEADRAKRAREELKTSREQLERNVAAEEARRRPAPPAVQTGTEVITGGNAPLQPGRSPLGQYGIDRYGSYTNRPGDHLAGHEVLQNAWLQVRGHATRLHGAISRDNPAVALSQREHQAVDLAQRALGLFDHSRLAQMTAQQVIDANAQAMRNARIPEHVIQTIKAAAERHARAHGL